MAGPANTGLKAETTKREPPQEWRDSTGRWLRCSSFTYTTSDIFCTDRCHAKWNKLPWPPVKEEAGVDF